VTPITLPVTKISVPNEKDTVETCLFIWALPVSFVIFNVTFIYWAVKTYPHNNPMAGFAALICYFYLRLSCGAGMQFSDVRGCAGGFQREGEQRPKS
jgi:hypothetical protein